ncbi:hypothetical protein F4819DRAFT_482898 [Hypoxylon fuscum]|nr:hypothetical protein F4819DRAFT_482898 [Hypoxylon fuscum]
MAQHRRFALVTGCGQGGIGEALVKQYALAGLHPIATVLPSEPSDHLTKAGITWFPLDVTNEESIVDLKRQLFDLTGGRLHILVNNAGICYTMTAIDTDVTAVQKMFDVNVLGPMRMVHHFHEMLITSAGTIVNIGSVGGIVPYVYGASYNATKAALHHWGNTLRLEMAPLGQVFLRYPGSITSQVTNKLDKIISGEIGTNILKSDSSRELPQGLYLNGKCFTWELKASAGSYFSPLALEFKQHVQRVPDSTDRFQYAAKVVAQSLKPIPPAWFWYGKTTGIVRFFETFGCRTIWDYILWYVFDFGKLRDATRAQLKKEL